MAETPTRGYDLPEHATQPPDVVTWLTTGLTQVDVDVTMLIGLVDAVNNRLLYGPISQKPAALAPGQQYLAYEG